MAIKPHSPTPFPLYLIPSIPFRRRGDSTTTSTISSPSSSPSSSPPTASSPTFLSSAPSSHLRCSKCLTDLIPTTSIVSKGFTGRHGRAYLVSLPPPTSLDHAKYTPSSYLPPTALTSGDLPNTQTHKPVPRQLVTGAHTVSDISCRTCGSVLGWKYVEAEEESQRYKVGKFILETRRVVRGTAWEVGGEDEDLGEAGGVAARKADEEEVEFDSQDEDECEDLFAGSWTREGATKRRKSRAWR